MRDKRDGDHVRREDDHAGGDNDTCDEGDPETLDDLGNLEPKVGALDFLLCCSPRDVVREQVGEQSLREMDAEATEEEEATRVSVRANS